MTIDINQDQSISINRLILIINDQSLSKIRAVIDWYRYPITIDWYRLVEDFVTFQNLQVRRNRHKNITTLYALVVNAFYFNALNGNRRTILASFSYYNAPSTCIRFPMKTQKFLSVFASRPNVSHENGNQKRKGLKRYPKWKTITFGYGPILKTSKNGKWLHRAFTKKFW